MEPTTFGAIVATLDFIAQQAPQAIVANLVTDAYERLKASLTRGFGGDSDVVKSVEQLEAKADSEGRRLMLKEELESSGAESDPGVRAAAQELLDRLKAEPGGEQHVQNAFGSYISQADRGGTASVNVDSPRGRPGE